jgi:hypothetical protein
MKAYTKGPWHWDSGDIGIEYSRQYSDIYTDDETIIAEINWHIPEHEANAHLIAAAPDLYNALKDVLRSCRHDFGPGQEEEIKFQEAYSEQFAALKKARGESVDK